MDTVGPDFDPSELSSKREWTKIGNGSFGNVYKASLLGMSVAVKEIGKCVGPTSLAPATTPVAAFPVPNHPRVPLHARTARRLPASPARRRSQTDPRPFLPLVHPSQFQTRPRRGPEARPVLPASFSSSQRGPGVWRVRGERQAVHGDGISPLLPPQQERGEQDEHPSRHLRRRPRARPPSLRRATPPRRQGAQRPRHRRFQIRQTLRLRPRSRSSRPVARRGQSGDDARHRAAQVPRARGETHALVRRAERHLRVRSDVQTAPCAAAGIDAESVGEEDLAFVERLADDCTNDDKRRRPTAYECLQRCLDQRGRAIQLCSRDTASRRSRYWLDAPMDGGTWKRRRRDAESSDEETPSHRSDSDEDAVEGAERGDGRGEGRAEREEETPGDPGRGADGDHRRGKKRRRGVVEADSSGRDATRGATTRGDGEDEEEVEQRAR